MTEIVVIGASGAVGEGIVAASLARGWSVRAVARSASSLSRLPRASPSDRLELVVGSLETAEAATRLADAAGIAVADAVVIAVNTSLGKRPFDELRADELSQHLSANLVPHLIAGQVLVPLMKARSTYIGVGGGMADAVIQGWMHDSASQAAQRMIYRHLARVHRDDDVNVRELLVVSMVNSRANRATADPAWLTDREIGDRVCQIVADPGSDPGPIVTIEMPAMRD